MSSKVSFAVGTGRCGTKFLYRLLKYEPVVASAHEKHPLSDTFHRYCKWYNLPIDNEGFLVAKRNSIDNDLKHKKYSFEASAFLSLSILELYKAFDAKFMLLVRSPEKVINSYLRKGWYESPVHVKDYEKLPSFQGDMEFHHFLGRTLPKGGDMTRWMELTRVGKLAWYWNSLNREIVRQFSVLPPAQYCVVRLEDLTYDKYVGEIAPFLGFKAAVSQELFSSLVEEKPNSLGEVRSVTSWEPKERGEFLKEVEEMSRIFEYDPVRILSETEGVSSFAKHRKIGIAGFVKRRLK